MLSEDPMEVYTSPLREKLVSEVASYIGKSYRQGKAIYAVTQTNEGVTIQISCKNNNLENFWSGEWLSTW